MNKIEWRHYNLMLAIRNTGSLTNAARTLGVTQSAASHQVKEAERRLGVDLIVKKGRAIELTRAGDRLADAALICGPIIEQAETAAQQLNNSSIVRLRAAFGAQDGLGWVSALEAAMKKRNANIQIDLIASGEEPPGHLLLSDRADMAVEIGEGSYSGLRRHLIGMDELICIFSPGHVLSQRKTISPGDLENEIYLAHSLTPLSGFELETFFQPESRRPLHISVIQSLNAIITLVANGKGVSIQPKASISHALKSGQIIARSLRGKPRIQPWYLLMRTDLLISEQELPLEKMAKVIKRNLEI